MEEKKRRGQNEKVKGKKNGLDGWRGMKEEKKDEERKKKEE